jgi:hypothetical protein
MGEGAPAASGRCPRRHGFAQRPQEVGRTLVAPRRGLLHQCDPPRDIFGHAQAIVVQPPRLNCALVMLFAAACCQSSAARSYLWGTP